MYVISVHTYSLKYSKISSRWREFPMEKVMNMERQSSGTATGWEV